MKLDNCIIRKAKTRETPYVMISRAALQNPKLSFKARGLLAYILSLPDNWQIYIRELTKHSIDGKFAIRSAFAELRKAGHIKGNRIRNEKGYFTGYEFIVFEDPLNDIEIPFSENGEMVKNIRDYNHEYAEMLKHDVENSGLKWSEDGKTH